MVRGSRSRARRRWLGGGIVAVLVAGVVLLGLTYQGAATTDVKLNDGGVWVVSDKDVRVGRLNHPVGALDARLGGVPKQDVVQRGPVVFLRDLGLGTLTRIDPAAVSTSGAGVPVPMNGDVQLGDGRIGVLDLDSGAWRVLDLDEVNSLTDTAAKPTAKLGAGAAQAVADDGTAWGIDPGKARLVRVDRSGEVTTTDLDPALVKGARVQLTVVGGVPVVLATGAEPNRLTLIRPDQEPVDLTGQVDQGALLQAPSVGGTGVVLAAADRLLEIPLAGPGEPRTLANAPTLGVPARPVQAGGCANGAWSAATGASLARACAGHAPQEENLPGGAGGALVFRVNWERVALNEPASGNVWRVEDRVVLVDDWEDDVSPEQDPQNEEENTVERTQAELDRNQPNRPPVARDDAFGVRPGATVPLPALENDSDPDGDLLSVGAFTPIPESFGTLETAIGGRSLQVHVSSGATGEATFTYTADDGRGGTAEATVTLTVVPQDVNNPPAQREDVTVSLAQGRSVRTSVAGYWSDPDGDPVYLAGVTDPAGLQVAVEPNGQVDVADPGVDPGTYEVRLAIDDGRPEGRGTLTLTVEVLPAGPAAPVAVFDYATGFTDQAIVVSPLANDVDPTARRLSLALVAPTADAPNPVRRGDDVVVTSAVPGTFYYTYVVSNEDGQTADGLIRVTVRQPDPQAGPVAVRDLALLPEGGSVLVDLLANDDDPAGGLLVVQQVEVAPDSGLAVTLIEHRMVRVAATRTLTAPATFRYVVSNGIGTAEAEVVVVPLAGTDTSLPPVAVADVLTVRAGDQATVPVLANDRHPNGLELHLEPTLAQPPAAGVLFAQGDVLRYQAPAEAGTYSAVYTVVDSNGQKDSAEVTIRVTPAGGENAPPLPRSVESRAFGGEQIRIPIPMTGLDPEGDSVQLVGPATAPGLGRIVAVGPGYLDYQAFPGATGTDRFTYLVRDRLGATGSGTITVGVVPPAATNRPPVANPDVLKVRPGRHVEADVLANDTDPDGDVVALAGAPTGADAAGLEISVENNRLAFATPDDPGIHLVQYRIGDGHGGEAVGLLTVDVSPDHPLLAPVATDDLVPVTALLDGPSVEVPVTANDVDPDGAVSDLRVDFPAEAGDQPTARTDGKNVTIQLRPQRQVLLYRVTDQDDLSALAFIDVPGSDETGPVLRAGIAPIEARAGEPLRVALGDYIGSPRGGAIRITDQSTVRVTNGATFVVDDPSTLTYTAPADYRGSAAIVVEVTDAADLNAPGALTSLITLPVNVTGDTPVPPRVRNDSVTLEAGGDPVTRDLALLVEDQQGAPLSYALGEVPPGLTATRSGSQVQLRAAEGVAAGTVLTVPFTVTAGDTQPVTGAIVVTVTVTAKPLIQTNPDDLGPIQAGAARSADVLANDTNPFPGETRTITSVRVVEGSVATQIDGPNVILTPAADYVGRIVLTYRVVDRTGLPEREVEGRITAAVLGRPDAPSIPLVSSVANRAVTLAWSPPRDNGAPITHYTLTWAGGSQQCAGTTCTVTGLVNGTAYRFTATATNSVGESPASAPSPEAVPDVRPQPPAVPNATAGDQSADLSWAAPANEGTPIQRYDVQLSTGGQQSFPAGATSATIGSLTNGTDYQFRVRAVNGAPEPGEWSGWSAAVRPAGPPLPMAAPVPRAASQAEGARIEVSWGAAADNGAPITSYLLQVYVNGAPGQQVIVGGGQTTRVIEAEVDRVYSFTIAAVNARGTSVASPRSAEVRAFTAPGVVPNVSAAANGNPRQATLSYGSAPANGQAVSQYQYRYNNSGAWAIAPGSGGVIQVPSDGQNYTVTMRACNTFCGPESAPSAPFQTSGSAPPRPVLASAHDASTGNYFISWTVPVVSDRPIVTSMVSAKGEAFDAIPTTNGYPASYVFDGSGNRTVRVYFVDDLGRAGPIATITVN